MSKSTHYETSSTAFRVQYLGRPWPRFNRTIRQDEVEAYFAVQAPGATRRERELAAWRVRVVARFLRWRGRRARVETCKNGRPVCRGGRAFARQLRPTGLAPCCSTIYRWVRAFEANGPLALLCRRRGRKLGRGAAIDGALWLRLMRGVASGRAVVALDRELRLIAQRKKRPWPSLRTLQCKIRTCRALLERNRHLFAGVNPN